MLVVIICSFIFPAVNCLLCLQCSGISQPRHCKSVVECDVDKKCGVEQISVSNGQHLYDVGCFAMQECASNITKSGECRECCGKTLCNAQGCNEPGYPDVMGPICYNCPMSTNPSLCSSIEFCEVGQVCEYDFRREFGDLVYSGHCAHQQICTQNSASSAQIIGRDLDKRPSIVEHVCHGCCDLDLCNKQCAQTVKNPCDPDPCFQGRCVSTHDNYTCSCDSGFEGRNCSVIVDPCAPDPCVHGQCVSTQDNYTCSCDSGYWGSNCSFNPCVPEPCEHGQCFSTQYNYSCSCQFGFWGRNCSINACDPNPCEHGVCDPVLDNYTCSCDSGYEGRNCSVIIDPCIPDPCVHGQCVSSHDNYTCSCDSDFWGRNCSFLPSTDCYGLQKQNLGLPSGVYNVSLWRSHVKIPVLCDMTTESGGWTVIQHRYDGSVDFYRNLSEYSDGFGDVSTEFWLGLSYIKEIADNGNTTLRMEVSAADESSAYEEWPEFRLGDAPSYTLHVGGRGIGTAIDYGRFFERNNNGADFTAKGSHCGDFLHGGWWYAGCTLINLNGEYATPGTVSAYHSGEGGMVYYSFKENASLKTSKIMIRRNT
ncbi:neurogenic locus notch homolog protein 1-like isoform X2 [Mya arenaria]|uniref:neurogenic locus notch homolog protein 1-like isoform X2 n=1 Tax=Mya arenaria TaxID=6604 RepID=UPI0022E1340F|nr:neurogenic locus notch homolog protein 1-like isoform X2 [Mya arenaria]